MTEFAPRMMEFGDWYVGRYVKSVLSPNCYVTLVDVLIGVL